MALRCSGMSTMAITSTLSMLVAPSTRSLSVQRTIGLWATDTSIKVWDLENKNVLDELQAKDPPKNGIPWCVSLQWSADGNILFAGSTDGSIYVYEIGMA